MNNTTPPPLNQNRKINETLALIHAIYAGLLVVSILFLVFSELNQQTIPVLSLVIGLGLVGVLIYLNIQAFFKVKRGESRTLSRVMAVLMLFSFPIGTILGVIGLWKSSNSQWNQS